MDALVSCALLEVAAEGLEGCSLPTLWSGLHSHASAAGLRLDPAVEQAIWKALLTTTCLAFHVPGSSTTRPLSCTEPSIQTVEDAERVGLHVVGSEQLRESYLGVYDLKHCDSRLSAEQRMILERLGKARAEGVTQFQLAKEFGMSGKKLFYIVRSLESRGLVVRQSSIFRGERPVATNLIHLKRFAKDVKLGSQQRFEIQKADTSSLEHESKSTALSNTEELSPSGINDVRVNDDLPALETICKQLEEADGKVLVVSDLKVNLGYRFVRGHREWRRLLSRLTAAGLVEAFNAKVEQKVVSCLRLLHTFDRKAFSCKAHGLGADEAGTEQFLKGARRGQITEQVAELSINRQIYDYIKQGGSNGVAVTEIFTGLGLNNRRNYFRLTDMISKHSLHLEAENYKRATQYRVWAPENVPLLDKHNSSPVCQEERMMNTASMVKLRETSDRIDGDKSETFSIQSKQRSSVQPEKLPIVRKRGSRVPKYPLQISENLQHCDNAIRTTVAEANLLAEDELPVFGLELVPCKDSQMQEAMKDGQDLMLNTQPVTDQLSVSCEYLSIASSRSGQRVVAYSSAHSQREVWIMERLTRERFILRAELQKWLEEMEERKDTILDRKTVVRNLVKLQREGRCKCILVSIPGVKNYRQNRSIDVVLLPFVEVGPDLLGQIYERQREFDAHIRAQGSMRSKKSTLDGNIPVLTGLKRMPQTESQPAEKGGTLRDNGFVSARMVRCHMLHRFLWMYLSGHTEFDTDPSSPYGNRDRDSGFGGIFSLLAAVQAMPLELFLQVIGSTTTKHVKGLAERCRRGMRLSDLPTRESEALFDANASGRLSWLVDILRRLKLLRIVMIPAPIDHKNDKIPQVAVSYALEERPYIEEPPLHQPPSISGHVLNLGLPMRHDFYLSSKESVEDYWKNLEYFFCRADPSIARRVFPGSTVPELFGPRSWTSLRVMTMDQRTELQRRIGLDDNRRLPYKECVQIAQDLNLSLDQVLRVSYEKNHKLRLQEMQDSQEDASDLTNINIALGPRGFKRKQSSSSEGILESANLEIKRGKVRSQQKVLRHESKSSCREGELGSIERPENEMSEEAEDGRNESEAAFANHINVVRKFRPLRKKKFLWTSTSDRVLIARYTRQRAILGARYNRVDWNTIEGLPAPPETCRRRIAILKMVPAVRKLLMSLCNVLAARYTKYLCSQSGIHSLGIGKQFGLQGAEGFGRNAFANKPSVACDRGLSWDDFEDPSLSAELEDIIRCKNASRAKLLKKRAGSSHVGHSSLKHAAQILPGSMTSNNTGDLQKDKPGDMGDVTPMNVVDEVFGEDVLQTADLLGSTNEPLSLTLKSVENPRTRPNRAHVRKTLQRATTLAEVCSTDLVQKSVGAAMAVELIKLVFLNSAVESEVSEVLVDALRRCKESDIFTAFRFLKDQGMVAIGHDSRDFVLSPKFYQSSGASPFSPSISDESLSFEAWLKEMATELEQDWVVLKHEQEWGALSHLYALILSRQLAIAPFMPNIGIGEKEQEDLVRKRKRDMSSGTEDPRAVKAKSGAASVECGFGQRRERGFPGIQVKVHLETMSLERMLGLESLENSCFNSLSSSNLSVLEARGVATKNLELMGRSSDNSWVTEALPTLNKDISKSKLCVTAAASEETNDSPLAPRFQLKMPDFSLLAGIWEAVSMAGDEGLRMDDVGELAGGDEQERIQLGEECVEALQSYGLARKVMAFDHVRIVPYPHSESYFLHLPRLGARSEVKTDDRMDSENNDSADPNQQKIQSSVLFGYTNEVPRVNVVVKDSSSSSGAKNTITSREQPFDAFVEEVRDLVGTSYSGLGAAYFGSLNKSDAVDLVPVLPWLEVDGKENPILRKALTRRIMGIVMLKPGIREESIIEQVDVLNPTSCQKLLQLLVLDGHLLVRTQMEYDLASPPSLLLQTMIWSESVHRKCTCRRHYYANPLSTALL